MDKPVDNFGLVFVNMGLVFVNSRTGVWYSIIKPLFSICKHRTNVRQTGVWFSVSKLEYSIFKPNTCLV